MTVPTKAAFAFISLLAMMTCLAMSDHRFAFGQDAIAAGETQDAKVRDYDAALAAKLGADEFGMRKYVMAFLKAGPNRNQSAEDAQALQRAHMDNIKRLAKEGKLILAGPFLDNGPMRGIFVFDVETVEEAKELTLTDPAIKSGRLEMELHPWYGPATLREVVERSKAVTKTSF